MTYPVVLFLLLIGLAGVIAYAGDRLGAWVGRHRLSVFGARPRRTGQIVGVLAGILIMLSTLLVLALAFRNATRTLLDAQRTATELTRLQGQEREMQAQLEGLQDELEAARSQLASVQDELDQARAERDAAAADAEEARAQAQAAEAEVAEAEGEAEALQARVEEAQTELEDANARLAQLQDELELNEAQVADAETNLRQAREELAAAEEARDEALTERDAAQEQRDAARAEANAARETITQLQDAIEVLEEESSRLEEEARALREENEVLERQNEDLGAANADLASRNDALQELNENLEGRIRDSSSRAEELQERVETLTRDLEEETTRLAQVQQEFERVAAGDVTFESGELVYSGSIDAETPGEAREALARFVRDASEAASRRGAGEVVLSAEQVNGLAQEIAHTRGEDLVRLLSPRDQFDPVQVEVVVEALTNDRLLEAGRLLTSRDVHLGSEGLPSSQAELRAQIAQLKADALARLRRVGLDEFQLPAYPTLSEETFVNMLLRRNGAATIGVITLEEVHRSGPARLELVILD